MSDIVDAVLYLEAAGFVTGEILHVDGAKAPVTDHPSHTLAGVIAWATRDREDSRHGELRVLM
jgi:hypothetical protein